MSDFAGLPRALVIDDQISAAAKMTAAWMLCFADRHGEGFVSLETIAILMRVETRQVQKKFKELVDAGHAIKKKSIKGADGERVRGFRFVYLKTSMKDVIAQRKAALKDGLSNPESVLPAQQKRPPSAAKASSEDIPSMNTVVNTVVNTRETRGTRFPPTAVLTMEWHDWAKAERPELEPEAVFAKFRDYWISKPGAKGRKLDWTATWRNWVRDERSNHGTGTRNQTRSKGRNGFAAVIAGGGLDDL